MKFGVEIEVLAPPGLTRLSYASRVARYWDCRAERFFHRETEKHRRADSEPVLVLSPGFRVRKRCGQEVVRVVDDITLKADLNGQARAKPGWHNVASSDPRLLALAQAVCDPAASLDCVLEPLAARFGNAPIRQPDGSRRIVARSGLDVLAFPIRGDRQRACEVITRPITRGDDDGFLHDLISVIRDLGFFTPKEGAIHLHFDGQFLCSPMTIANLVRILAPRRALLHALVDTNPFCERLGPWSPELLETVNEPSFPSISWPEAVSRLRQANLTKYCDFNITNLVWPQPGKFTFEVRIFPVWLDPAPILASAALFAAVLRRAALPEPVEQLSNQVPTTPTEATVFLDELALDSSTRDWWLDRATDINRRPLAVV